MLPLIQMVLLLVLALTALLVVRTRVPAKQAVGVSFYGILLGLVFLAYGAPDVALSQIAIGAVALPLIILMTLAKLRKQAEAKERA